MLVGIGVYIYADTEILWGIFGACVNRDSFILLAGSQVCPVVAVRNDGENTVFIFG